MINYKIMFKSFFKTKFLSITAAILLLAMNCFEIFVFVVGQTADDPLTAILQYPIVFLAVFMLLSYEYFSKMRRCDAEEFITATERKRSSVYFSQLLVMLSVAVVFALNLFLLIGLQHVFSGNFHFQYLIHIFLTVFLNIFLVMCVGILVGMFSAFFFKRATAYLFILFFGFLSSPYPAMFIKNDILYKIYDLFNICINSFASTPNRVFGYSLVGYRWLRVLFWIALFFGICCFKLFKNNKNQKIITACISFAVCIVSVGCFCLPWSKVDSAEHYQLKELDFYQSAEVKESEADFSISSYKMELDTLRELNADVLMIIGDNDLTEYNFTLYHGYRIKSVTDEKGNELKYSRNSDYFTVYGDKPLNSIRIKYAGSNMTYYSNMQGVYLSAGFPYYPKPGFGILFDGGLMTPYVNEEKSIFDIKIRTGREVFSNISSDGKNHFCGEARDVTLFSGLLDCEKVDGTEVVFPYLATDMLNVNDIAEETRNLKQSKFWKSDVDRIFSVYPGNLGWRTLICGNEMEYYGYFDVRKYYDMGFINEDKQSIYPCSYSYLNNITSGMDRFDFYIQSENGSGFATELKKLEKEYGREYVVKMLNDYLYDNNDTRTPDEFIKAFGGGK